GGFASAQGVPGLDRVLRADDAAKAHRPQLIERDAAFIMVFIQDQRRQAGRIEGILEHGRNLSPTKSLHAYHERIDEVLKRPVDKALSVGLRLLDPADQRDLLPDLARKAGGQVLHLRY